MPLYTLKNTKTNEHFDVNCSYDEMKKTLEEQPDLERVISSPNFVSSLKTHANSNTSDGWKDLLGRIKKGSGRNNTIKT